MSVVQLHPIKPKTGAERAKAYRARKAKAKTVVAAEALPVAMTPEGMGITAPVTLADRERQVAPILLTVAAFGLALVGITMNGWFARTLGSSDIAGWLFLAIGVAADLVALVMPTCAALNWRARQRWTAAAGWSIYLATFAFALTAGIGFASVNVGDVAAARGARVTPAVTIAQAALADAMASRDRECNGGVGKNCRAREDAVSDRRKALDAALATVEQSADPQIENAARVVSWVSAGLVRPSPNDLAMLRLILLAGLPQVGGILLMVARKR
jgi:hypothetical protein